MTEASFPADRENEKPVQSHHLRLRVYHTCKQLMDSVGEAYEAYQRMANKTQVVFLFNLAETSAQYGLGNHARWILRHEGMLEGYERWKSTLARLEGIDPNWKEYATVHAQRDGVQLDIGGFHRSEPFSASIISNRISYGRDDNLYEIMPVFGGKKMSAVLPDRCEDIVGWLPLEKAVAIAHATLSRDEGTFRRAVETAYQ